MKNESEKMGDEKKRNLSERKEKTKEGWC